MFREKERNKVNTKIKISRKANIERRVILNIKMFITQSIRNRTNKNLFRLSVPYRPCINIENFCIKFLMVIFLSTIDVL
jgi:hypothetical protein